MRFNWIELRGALGVAATTIPLAFACGGRLEPSDLSSATYSPTEPVSPTLDASIVSAPDAASAREDSSTSVDSPVDAGTGDAGNVIESGIDDTGVDASLAAPCLAGGNIFVVDGDGIPGVQGLETISGSEGTWSTRVTSELSLQLNVAPPDGGTWVFAVIFPATGGIPLRAGTYASMAGVESIYAGVETSTGGCHAVSTGPFTIAEIEYPDEDQSTLTSLLAWFDLSCPQGGTLRGCVSYGR
jgi:hypothetical protein